MTEPKQDQSELAEEFRRLGKNLSDALKMAWERPERKRVEEEISTGLNNLGNALKSEARNFSESSTGQRLRTEAEQAGQDLIRVLHTTNEELRRAIDHWKTSDQVDEGDEDPTTMPDTGSRHVEVHPDDVDAPPRWSDHEEIHPDDVES